MKTSILPTAIIVAGAVGVFLYLILTPRSPTPDEDRIQPRIVRVFEARRAPHRMAVTAYGTSRASEEWTAIAEVSGRAIEVNQRFEVGEILPEGMVLVRIDPTDYQLAVERLEAEIRSKELEADELEQNEENLGRILDLQQQQLDLAVKERDRLKSLVARNAASDSDLDVAQSALVGNLTTLQETKNNLAMIPVQRELLSASLKVLQVQLDQSRRELAKCQIRLPFAARCASKSIEAEQYVAPGERLGSFLALDKAEVVTMVETRKMHALFPRGIPELGTLDLTQMDLDESVFNRVEVPAEVRWGPWQEPQVWQGKVARLAGALDQNTRALPVIVEVPDPYKDIRPGVRPPLVPDVFCHVTLFGATVDDVVVIPRDSLREKPRPERQVEPGVHAFVGDDYSVYLLRDNKLHIAPVTILALEEELAVVEEGIEDGDLVVLTDLFPVSEGMPLVGQLDETVAAELSRAAPAPQPAPATEVPR